MKDKGNPNMQLIIILFSMLNYADTYGEKRIELPLQLI